MKLALKLAAAFVFGIGLGLVLHGVSRVRSAAALFENDTRRDHFAIGHTLATAVADVWMRNGWDHALSLVERVNRERTHVAIRWVSLEAGAPSAVRPRVDQRELGPVRAGKDLSVVEDKGSHAGRTRISYVPVRVGGQVKGAVELGESLERERRYLENIVRRTALTGLLISGLCGLLAVGLGYAMVGRPVKRLMEMARRVGQGDFSQRIPVRPRDELGRLAVELNTMVDQLAQTSARLAAETQSRIAAIAQLRHAGRLSTVGQLASGMAHELGTPLQVISGRGKLIMRRELSEPELKESATVIVEQAERITRIIRQLLDFARQRSPNKVRRDLVPIVDSTLGLLQPLAGRHRASLTFLRPEQGVEADVDGDQLQQVLTNLVVNGMQSMPGGGTVRVAITRKRLKPPADHGGDEGEYVCIEVEDEGTGIPEEVLPRIFEPFFTTKEVGEGTGLGLSVSYGIVREHGGWIEVENRPARGSRFSICLPPVA